MANDNLHLLALLEVASEDVTTIDRFVLAGMLRDAASVISKQDERIRELETRIADARAKAEQACKYYCDWYSNGKSCDAGNVCYSMVAYQRLVLQALHYNDEESE